MNHSVPGYVIRNTQRIVKELGYKGLAEFEYKQDEITGKFKLIEINPRAWSWIGITAVCEDNLVLLSFRDMSGEGLTRTRKSRIMPDGSVIYVKILKDILYYIFKYRIGFKEWKNSLRAKKVIYAEFSAGDWPVYIKAVIDELFLKPVKGAVKLLIKAVIRIKRGK